MSIAKWFAGVSAAVICDATAALMIVDPDDGWGGPGTAVLLYTFFDDVTLSTNVDNNSVFSLSSGVPEVPGWMPSVFGHGAINFPSGACSGCWSFGFAELRADFSRPASLVQMDFIDRFAGDAIVRAYSSSGDLLDQASLSLVGNEAANAARVAVTVESYDVAISYVLAGASTGDYGVIDRLAWRSFEVPAPSALALTTLGPLYLRVWRNR
ncbi:MAG: hypothetical protein V2I24_07570 [Halieaceae bacterium]|jgi:hypothetical protein|nr:hypothetical protein [Halieaceae bacterium]